MSQYDFWSNNPCGVDGALGALIEQRYRMEPWLPRELRTIPHGLGKYLEVGCGQGADSFLICSHLNKDDDYLAIDYSTESVARAKGNIGNAKEIFNLKTMPKFIQGDALNLKFDNDEFDFIYSMGVLHHTPNPQQAIDEVFRPHPPLTVVNSSMSLIRGTRPRKSGPTAPIAPKATRNGWQKRC